MKFLFSARNFSRNRSLVILLFAFFICLLATGCGKDSDGSGGDYYMRFTINGEVKEFKGNTLAVFTSPGYDASMVALKDATNASDNTMSIVLNSESPFTTNTTYTEAVNGNGETSAFLIYNDELGNIFTSLGVTLAPETKVAVQFTSITDGSVKGTFSGTLYDEAFTSADYTITNGSFYLKRE